MKLDDLAGRIPVEPLGDERLTNLERRIVTAASERVPVRGFGVPRLAAVRGVAVIAAIILGAGAAGWALRGDARPAIGGAPLAFHTAAARATLDIGDATITTEGATAFTITRPGGGVTLALARGKVALEVGTRAGRAPLVVAAGDTRVIVVGTQFSVAYGDGTGDVDVHVTEGVVEVERHRQTVRVAAGEAWTTARGVIARESAPPQAATTIAARDPATATAASTPSATSAAAWVRRATAAAGDAAPGDTVTPAPPADQRGAGHASIEVGEAPEVLHERVAIVPGARSTAGRDERRGAAAAEASRPSAGTTTPTGGALDLRRLILAQPLALALDVGEAAPAKAVAAYRMIAAKTTGDRASHAFYSIALLQHTRLGRNADALATLDAYLRRFSGGRDYGAALWLRVRILCTRAIDDRCRQAAHTYLRHGQDTPAAKIAERLTLSPR